MDMMIYFRDSNEKIIRKTITQLRTNGKHFCNDDGTTGHHRRSQVFINK